MSKYQEFSFDSYDFDANSGILSLQYSMDNTLKFVEGYRFDFPYVQYDENILDRALQALFFMAGVSYYKAFIPPKITVRTGELDRVMSTFFSKTYQRGLGEFWYVNNLDPATPVEFPITIPEPVVPFQYNGVGQAIAIGGGKDSLLSEELLRGQPPEPMTWSLNHRPQLTPLIQRVGSQHAWVERSWDPKLLELNKDGAYNGHIPISAIFACVGTVVAILSGKRDIVMSNELSASEPTLTYKNMEINHQYSKSLEFERDYQQYLIHTIGISPRYYSFLRPLSELRIAELFAKYGFEKYKDVFSSCNRAFVLSSNGISWCGNCPKCAFTFLIFTPFIERTELEAVWGGKNLLLDPALEVTYKQLLGIKGDKPLDCVGEIKESRTAMDLAKKFYPELSKYHYDVPSDYNYQFVGNHLMPREEFIRLQSALDPLSTDAPQ